MGTNTGIGIGIGIPFKNNALGGDRPYLPPELKARLIGVWDNYGKKNTDADRNIIKNKIHNAGGDLEILNSAYRLNSGFGKYSNDFQEYTYSENVVVKDNTNAIFNSRGKLLVSYSYLTKDIPSFKIKVSGLSNTYHFRYYYRDSNGVQHSVDMAKDGNYELPICYNVQSSSDGTSCGFTNYGSDIVSVEILPEYEGAFVTDGVNDMIISQKTLQEMGVTKDFTIVSMIHQITLRGATAAALTNYIRQPIGSEYVRNHVANIGKTGIYGYAVYDVNHSNANNSHVINTILGDKNDYSIHIIGNLSQGKFSVQGYINGEDNVVELSQVAWYWTFIAKGVLTTDEINQVIAYYNLDKYVKPDIYYDVKKQGLTNDTPDEDWYLKDFSGNGRDMTLYNYTKTPESGINEEGGLQSDGVNDFGQFVGDLGLKDYTVAADRAYQDENVNCVPFISSVGRTGGAPFLMEMVHPTSHVTYPYSFGTPTESVVLNSSRQISYQSTYVYNRNSIARGNSVKTGDGLTIGSNEGVSQYSKLCLWSFLLFPYTLSEFLLERQLKKHKLGTLYPGMVEFRPIVKSNIPYSSISYSVNPGEYVIEGSTVTITITLSNSSDKLVDISSNAISDISISGDNGVYEVTGKVTKSPQKINIVISSYLTMLDNETLISNETLIKNE